MALSLKAASISSTWQEANASQRQELKVTFLSRRPILTRVWHIWATVSARWPKPNRTYLSETQSWHSSWRTHSVEIQRRPLFARQASRWCILKSLYRHWTLHRAQKRSRLRLRRMSCARQPKWCSWSRSSRPRWKLCELNSKKTASSQTSVLTN